MAMTALAWSARMLRDQGMPSGDLKNDSAALELVRAVISTLAHCEHRTRSPDLRRSGSYSVPFASAWRDRRENEEFDHTVAVGGQGST